MSDLISREKILKLPQRKGYAVNGWETYVRVSDIKELPSEQPERTGKWIDCNNSEHWKCSECGYRGPYSWDDQHGFEEWLSDYCPNCGARMES